MSVDALIGKRVYLVQPPGCYQHYAGTVVGRWPAFKGSSIDHLWANVDWDVKVHPCSTPIEIKNLRLAKPGEGPQVDGEPIWPAPAVRVEDGRVFVDAGQCLPPPIMSVTMIDTMPEDWLDK